MPESPRVRLGAILFMALMLTAACGGDQASDPGSTNVGGAGAELETGDGVEDSALNLEDLEDVSDPEHLRLTATGLLEGEFSTFPRCDFREDDQGEYLHVFFAFFDESRPEIPTIDVVLQLRPFEVEGDFAVEDDAEIEFRHGDFSNQEVMEGTVTGTVERTESESGLPLAVIAFEGSYRGDAGEGSFAGELSCIALPA